MLSSLIGAVAGACLGFVRWKNRAVHVHGRFFPHRGSRMSLILGMAACATAFALVFLGADAMTGDTGRQAEERAPDHDLLPPAADGAAAGGQTRSPRIIEGIPFVASSEH